MNEFEKIFDHLDEWRNFPGYQLERRADIFFGIHMKDILEAKLGKKIDLVIPEFPIRKGNLPQNDKYNVDPNSGPNRSFNIDYVCISEEPNLSVFFIELKTDVGSRNQKQDWYLEEARTLKIKGLVNGLLSIHSATRSKRKYTHLIDQLVNFGWVKMEDYKYVNMEIQLIPEVLYIQPSNLTNDQSVITFDDIYSYLNNSQSQLTKRFLESLKKWKK